MFQIQAEWSPCVIGGLGLAKKQLDLVHTYYMQKQQPFSKVGLMFYDAQKILLTDCCDNEIDLLTVTQYWSSDGVF